MGENEKKNYYVANWEQNIFKIMTCFFFYICISVRFFTSSWNSVMEIRKLFSHSLRTWMDVTYVSFIIMYIRFQLLKLKLVLSLLCHMYWILNSKFLRIGNIEHSVLWDNNRYFFFLLFKVFFFLTQPQRKEKYLVKYQNTNLEVNNWSSLKAWDKDN